MKILLWLCLLPFGVHGIQTLDLTKVRALYHTAPDIEQDAIQLNSLMLHVDTTKDPVLICYKGANEMIQAKYSFNPITKLNKVNKGRSLIQQAFKRDTLNLEIRFIRYSIQSNLPTFLGYHQELGADKKFLLDNTKTHQDADLKKIILNYLSTQPNIKPEELKHLKN